MIYWLEEVPGFLVPLLHLDVINQVNEIWFEFSVEK